MADIIDPDAIYYRFVDMSEIVRLPNGAYAWNMNSNNVTMDVYQYLSKELWGVGGPIIGIMKWVPEETVKERRGLSYAQLRYTFERANDKLNPKKRPCVAFTGQNLLDHFGAEGLTVAAMTLEPVSKETAANYAARDKNITSIMCNDVKHRNGVAQVARLGKEMPEKNEEEVDLIVRCQRPMPVIFCHFDNKNIVDPLGPMRKFLKRCVVLPTVLKEYLERLPYKSGLTGNFEEDQPLFPGNNGGLEFNPKTDAGKKVDLDFFKLGGNNNVGKTDVEFTKAMKSAMRSLHFSGDLIKFFGDQAREVGLRTAIEAVSRTINSLQYDQLNWREGVRKDEKAVGREWMGRVLQRVAMLDQALMLKFDRGETFPPDIFQGDTAIQQTIYRIQHKIRSANPSQNAALTDICKTSLINLCMFLDLGNEAAAFRDAKSLPDLRAIANQIANYPDTSDHAKTIGTRLVNALDAALTAQQHLNNALPAASTGTAMNRTPTRNPPPSKKTKKDPNREID